MSGKVLSVGYGFFGQCGVGDTKTQKSLVKVNLDDVEMIASGDSHCIVVDKGGRVFSWGSNRFGQCGVLPFGNFTSPTLIEPLCPLKVTSIACGTSHCVAAVASGDVFTFGCGTEGRLGLGDDGPRYAPIKVEMPLPNTKVISVAAGMLFTVVLTDKGKVFSWGANRYGQLGIQQLKTHKTPQRVTALDSMFIEKIACGRSHTLVVTEKGSILGFGHNMCGQLGDNSTEDTKLPRLSSFPPGTKTKSIACGYYHSICLTDDGTVYSWGYNAEGALGLGAVLGHQSTPHSLNHSLSEILKPDEKVVDVKAGGWHSALITSTGRLITFGLGETYRLGHGTEDDLRTPKVVEGVVAKSVACGGAHTLILTGGEADVRILE